MELFDTCFFCHAPIKVGDNLVAVSHVTCTGYYAIDDDRQLREFQDEIRLPEFDTPYGAVYCYECWDSISAMAALIMRWKERTSNVERRHR